MRFVETSSLTRWTIAVKLDRVKYDSRGSCMMCECLIVRVCQDERELKRVVCALSDNCHVDQMLRAFTINHNETSSLCAVFSDVAQSALH